jgi:hypothetical protein
MSEHTSGPWTVVDVPDNYDDGHNEPRLDVLDKHGEKVACFYSPDNIDCATASLIARAPDMQAEIESLKLALRSLAIVQQHRCSVVCLLCNETAVAGTEVVHRPECPLHERKQP